MGYRKEITTCREQGQRRRLVTEDQQTLTSGLQDSAAATVEALARALELHDYRRGRFGETASHTARVTQLAMKLAGEVAPELTFDPQLAYGFRLHDIGMIGVSTSALVKQ